MIQCSPIMNRYKLSLIMVTLLVATLTATAQKEERKAIREGNSQYKDQKFSEAEIAYRKALDVNSKSPEAMFNLGDALYRQGKYQQAAEQFAMTGELTPDRAKKAQAYHNLGNAMLKSRDYQKSIEAYKQALRMNPKDDDTRFNLALAQSFLQQQQQQDQNKDQDKDKDKQDQQQQNQPNKPNDPKQDQKKEEQQQQPQNPNQMNKENAEKILDAFMQDEKNTQEKVKKAQAKQQNRNVEKNW